MKHLLIVTMAAAAAVSTAVVVTTAGPENDREKLDAQAPPNAVVHWARGHAKPNGGGSPNLTYHGGPVMTQGAYVEPIYWGASWGQGGFVGDKRTGLQTFYTGLGGASYTATNDEYSDTTGFNVGTAVTFGGDHVDLSASPRSGSRTSPILAEACSKATNLMPDGYYPVYVDAPRGHAGYCAWHSAGTCANGTTIQFAFFFNLDGDAGCDPNDTSGQHSQGLSALANVSGHEISEALTDPQLNAWYDPSGAENSDKCAWSFGAPLLSLANASLWKIQGNWSNAAFNGGTGYPNASNQKGCSDGSPLYP